MALSRRLVLVGLVLLGACGRAGLRTTAPVVAPTAAPAPAVAAAPSPRVTPPVVVPVVDVEGTAAAAESAVPVIETPAAEAPPVTWDIQVLPYESHSPVEYFVGRFTGAARNAF